MAQFFTDFGEYTPGQQPSDWTERWNVANGASIVDDTDVPTGGGAQALRVSLSSNVRYALSWDEVGTPSGDVEVLIKALHAHTGNVNAAQYRPTLHGSGSAGTESGYYTGLNSQFGQLYLSAFKGGASSNLQSAVAGSANTQNVWYWLRIQRTGTTVRSRFWMDGEEEPEAWRASGTDGDLTSGWVGVGSGHSSGVVWYAQVGVGTGGDPAPSEAPESPSVELAARLEFGLATRAAIQPTRTLAARLELGAAIIPDVQVTRTLAARLEFGLEQRASIDIPTGVELAARLVFGAGIRAQPQVTRQLAARLVFGLEQRGSLQTGAPAIELAARLVFGVGMQAQPVVTRTLAARLEFAVNTSGALLITRQLAARLVLGVDLREGYTGPGTGLVVSGQRFTPNTLREGDTFRVVLPWAGISGMTGLAHVNSRTLRDDRAEQDIDLHIEPLDRPNIPALAGGARPVAGADSGDYARRQARMEREQDRIERNR